MKNLKSFSAYLRKNFLRELAVENFRMVSSMDVPLMKLDFIVNLLSNLTEEQKIEMGMTNMDKFLTSLEEGTAIQQAKEVLEQWEANKLPGIPKNAIHPSDLVLIYVAQKKTFLKFLTSYTNVVEEAVSIIQELEDYYMEVQNNAVQMLYRIQKDADDSLKKSEEELKKSQYFLNSIIENIPLMIFVKDAKDLRFVRFNKAGERLLGYSKEDLIGKNDYDFFPKEQADFFTGKDRGILNNGKLEEIPEELITTKDKGVRILETKKIPLFDKEGKTEYLIGISNDITERRKMEDTIRQRAKDLEQMTQELLRSNQELEQFAYVASHDLQEPLRMVNSYVQLLANRYKDKLDKEANDFIDYAVDGSNRMRSLINSLLEYSRVNTIHPFKWMDTNAVLDKVILSMKPSIQETDTTITYGQLPKIYGDETQIGQLFQNLLSNAIKFRNDKKTEIIISGKKTNEGFLFAVKDNGIGIKMEYADKIFLIFHRLNSKVKYPGTGIGLSICKKIVERHNGKIWVESVQEKGSTFYFTIGNTKQ